MGMILQNQWGKARQLSVLLRNKPCTTVLKIAWVGFIYYIGWGFPLVGEGLRTEVRVVLRANTGISADIGQNASKNSEHILSQRLANPMISEASKVKVRVHVLYPTLANPMISEASKVKLRVHVPYPTLANPMISKASVVNNKSNKADNRSSGSSGSSGTNGIIAGVVKEEYLADSWLVAGDKLAVARAKSDRLEVNSLEKSASQPLQPQASVKTYAEHPEIIRFMTFMEKKHDYPRETLRLLFSGLIMDEGESNKLVTYTNQAPEVKMNWVRYRKQFLTRERIAQGALFWKEYRTSLRKVRRKYGIPESIMVATLGMESFYGKYNGKLLILRALTTFVAERGRRQKFYFRELEHYLLFCKQNQYNPLLVNGSYSGAMGPAQFIATSAMYYARDGDGDGIIDLFTNFDDIIESVGNYYNHCRWKRRRPVAKRLNHAPAKKKHSTGQPYLLVKTSKGPEHWKLYANYTSLKCYNNSHLYALTLYQLSQAIKQDYLDL